MSSNRRCSTQSLLRAARPDLDALSELVLGEDADTAALGDLRALTAITVPGASAVSAAGERVRAGLRGVAATSTTDATSTAAVVDLLQAALRHHTTHGDMACPVCRAGTLDANWRARASAELDRLRGTVTRLHDARTELRTAVEAMRRLSTPAPAVLARDVREVDVSGVRVAWRSWDDATTADPQNLPDTLAAAHGELVGALAAMQAAARSELVRLDETWRPLSGRLWAWHEEAEQVAATATTVSDLRKAEAWLKDTATELINQRVAPFAARSQEIWRQLRQESNIELGGITLSGSGNQRKVLLDVTVDGTNGAALSVMSQGELHALGLALFLPRATRDESPFRFIVIDDPVQAMDPAKVDGLAGVLSGIARTRQVLVFSHDDRLADAVRRLPDPARMYEVQRRGRSQVTVVANSDPVMRYLADATAVIKDGAMPDELRREIVVNCCRGALEAASHAKVRRVRLGRGDAHLDVEEALAKAVTTHDTVTLAVFDDASRGADLLPRLNGIGRWAADTLQACKQGAHRTFRGDLATLVRDTRELAAKVLR